MWTNFGSRSVDSQYFINDVDDVRLNVDVDDVWWFGFRCGDVCGDEFGNRGVFGVGFDAVCDVGWFVHGDCDEGSRHELQPSNVKCHDDHGVQSKPDHHVHQSWDDDVVEYTADLVGLVNIWTLSDGHFEHDECLHRVGIDPDDGFVWFMFAFCRTGRRYELQRSIDCVAVIQHHWHGPNGYHG